MRGQLRIEQMFAFIALDPADNTEGVVSMTLPTLGTTPLVGADMKRVESLRPYARDIARKLGVKITIARFTIREDVEVISP